MEQKPGWTYIFIKSLNQYIAISEKSGVLYTEDKTMYTAEECKLLKKVNYEIPLQVHLVKRAFPGILIQV